MYQHSMFRRRVGGKAAKGLLFGLSIHLLLFCVYSRRENYSEILWILIGSACADPEGGQGD